MGKMRGNSGKWRNPGNKTGYAKASPVKVTSADGTVRIEKPLSPQAHRRVVTEGIARAKSQRYAWARRTDNLHAVKWQEQDH